MPPSLAGESKGGTCITLAFRTQERLRTGPSLVPKAVPTRISPKADPTWQLPASAAPPSLGQAEMPRKRKRAGATRYKEGREDGYTASVGFS
jgi:hypothetical protein